MAIYSKAKKGIVGTFSLGMPRKSRKRWSTFSLVSALTEGGEDGEVSGSQSMASSPAASASPGKQTQILGCIPGLLTGRDKLVRGRG